MKRGICFIVLIFSVWSCTLLYAARDLYPFKNTTQKVQFQHLIDNTRCVVCQNESIADSDAALAADMRGLIYQKVQEGDSTENIHRYLVSRYGEFITLSPPFNPETYILWLLPFVLLAFAVVLVFLRWFYKRNKK